jgi:enoyl-CoA hydratase/carnithine racemase
MAFVETERHGQVMVIRMNGRSVSTRSARSRSGLAEAWCEFRDSDQARGGRVHRDWPRFCAGEDSEGVRRARRAGEGQHTIADPFRDRTRSNP